MSAHLEPSADAGGAMFWDRGLERPFARVVGDEGDVGGAAGLDEDSIAPIGLPPVVHRMQEPGDMPPKPQRLDNRGLVGEREHSRRAARKEVGWLRRPIDEGDAVHRERRRSAPRDRKVAAPCGFKRDLRRQKRIDGKARRRGARADRLAFGRDRNEWQVGRARPAAQRKPDPGACVARHVEH